MPPGAEGASKVPTPVPGAICCDSGTAGAAGAAAFGAVLLMERPPGAPTGAALMGTFLKFRIEFRGIAVRSSA